MQKSTRTSQACDLWRVANSAATALTLVLSVATLVLVLNVPKNVEDRLESPSPQPSTDVSVAVNQTSVGVGDPTCTNEIKQFEDGHEYFYCPIEGLNPEYDMKSLNRAQLSFDLGEAHLEYVEANNCGATNPSNCGCQALVGAGLATEAFDRFTLDFLSSNYMQACVCYMKSASAVGVGFTDITISGSGVAACDVKRTIGECVGGPTGSCPICDELKDTKCNSGTWTYTKA